MSYIKALSSPSTKTKTMIFVLMLFLAMATIFGWMRYVDVRDGIEKSRKDYAAQIHSIYAMTLKRTSAFYLNRAYANLDSYGIKEALEQKNVAQLTGLSSFRWNVLKQENPYLLGIRFYDETLSLLAYLGKEPKKEEIAQNGEVPKESKVGFFFSKHYAAYHIMVPVFVNEKIIGMLEFAIAPEFFLNEVEEFSNLKGYILFKGEEFMPSDEALLGISLHDGEISQNKKSTYITHAIKLEGLLGDDLAELFFFQDISDQQQKLLDAVYEAFFVALSMMAVLLIILNYGFNVLILRLEESEASLKELNHTLEFRVNEEIARRMENEQILMHQSRLASMGEMIGNIAHQWRQPLSELGATLMNLQILWEKQKLTSAVFEDRIKRSEGLIAYMSKTIDDFRNFFASDNKKERYCVNDAIRKSLELIEPALKNHHIVLEFHEEGEYEIEGYPSQFAQAILNIISNAKDILLERGIHAPKIEITLKCKEGKTLIQIADNGGGITLEPIEKIFEPYVSTKHAKSGTGIGLYMSKSIIEKNANGVLSAYNSDIGAVFEITL
ncbi:ATP-binding protein [Sulfurospirillum sp. 'SP']|nr:ATP-binding protein [Sulfurospirillum sp. 'SP']WNY99588.1 ATP-binding protein [Sulfurospirillum sp. 'SP']